MREVTLKFTGSRMLLMHNVRLANPFDKYSKALAGLMKEKKVKGADQEAIAERIARVEWEGGLYHTATDIGPKATVEGPYLPSRAVHQAVHEGAKMTREGAGVREGSIVVGDRCMLEYDGPKSIEEMWAGGLVDQRIVVVGQAKVMRCRPAFQVGWSCVVRFMLEPEVVDPDRFVTWARSAGAFKGVGDGRLGVFGMGRFDVEAV